MRTLVAILPLLASCSYANDWTMYLADPAHSSFNAAEGILRADTVAHLAPQWSVSLDAPVSAAPIIVENVLFVGDWNGYFWSIDARDGRVYWKQLVGKAPNPANPMCMAGIGVAGQAVMQDDVVYVPGGDSAIYALDRYTGQVIWRVQVADPTKGAYLWSSITPFRNALYVGVASLSDCPLYRGELLRIDLKNPTKPLVKYLAPPDVIGAGVWSSPAIDEATNTVFVTTGTGNQDAKTGLWGGTLLALDADTLAVKSYFFLPTNSLEDDIEWGSSPTLFTSADGKPLLAASGKDGILYALTRDGLKLVWQTTVAFGCICPECGCGSLSTPAFDGATLFSGAGVSIADPTKHGTVHSIDPTSGKLKWSSLIDGVVIAPVTVANGVVYVGSTKGFEVRDAASGSLLWNDGRDDIVYSQPVVVDGSIYVTYFNGDVVAWRVEDYFREGDARRGGKKDRVP